VPRNRKVQSESDFAVPYHFTISPTCGFAFRQRILWVDIDSSGT